MYINLKKYYEGKGQGYVFHTEIDRSPELIATNIRER